MNSFSARLKVELFCRAYGNWNCEFGSVAKALDRSFDLSSIPDFKLTCSINPSQHRLDHFLPTGLSTGLQPDCLHGLRTTLRYVLVLPLSSFSRRVCRT